MTQHGLADIGVGLAAFGVPALLLGLVAAVVVRKRGRKPTWQGSVRLIGVIFTVGAIAIGFGIAEWNNAHAGVYAGPTYGDPLQDRAPDTGCPEDLLTC